MATDVESIGATNINPGIPDGPVSDKELSTFDKISSKIFWSEEKRKQLAAAEAAKKKAATDAAAALQRTLTTGNTYEKRKFINETNTGIKLNKDGRPEGRTSETVMLSNNLLLQYRKYMNDHLFNLSRLYDPKNGFAGSALDNPAHSHERRIYREIVGDSGSIPADINKKIEVYLAKEENILKIKQLMEEEMERKMMAVSMMASFNPGGYRESDTWTGKVRTKQDEGAIRAAWNDKVYPFLLNQITVGGRPPEIRKGRLRLAGSTMETELFNRYRRVVALAANIGVSTGVEIAAVSAAIATANPALILAGPAVFGGMAAVEGIGSGIAASMRRGLEIQKKNSGAGFDAIANDPAERRYVEAMYGIFTSDFHHDPGSNDFQVRQNKRTVGVEQLIADCMQMGFTRIQTYQEMFRDQPELIRNVDFFPSEAITEGSPTSQQTRLQDDIEVDRIYREHADRLTPLAAHASDVEYQQRQTELIKLKFQARHEYFLQLHAKEISLKTLQREKANEARLGQSLQGALVARTHETGAVYTRMSADIDKRLSPINEIITTLGTETPALEATLEFDNDYNEASLALHDRKNLVGVGGVSDQEAVDTLNQYVNSVNRNVFRSGLTIDGVNIGGESINFQIQKILEAVKKDLTDAVKDLAPLTQAISEAQAEYDKANDKIAGVDRRIDSLTKTKNTFEATLQKSKDPAERTTLQTSINQIDTTINGLIGDRDTLYDDRQKASNKKAQAEAARMPKQAEFDILSNRLNTITSNPQNDPETRALESLRTRINEELTAIKDLIKARDEAQTKREEKKKTDPAFKKSEALQKDYQEQHNLFNRVFSIANVDLINKSIDEIMTQEINILHPGNQEAWPAQQNTLPERRQQVLHAKMEAMAREVAQTNATTNGSPFSGIVTTEDRIEAFKRYSAQLARNKSVIEAEKRTIPAQLQHEVAEIQTAIELNARRAEGFQDDAEIFTEQINQTSLALLETVVPQTNDPDIAGSTDTERVTLNINGTNIDFSTQPRIYFELLKLATSYEPHDFAKWATRFPPDELLAFFNDIIMPPSFPATDLRTLASSLKSRVTSQNVDSDYIRQALQKGVLKRVTSAARFAQP